MKNKILMSGLVCTLVFGLTMPNSIRANEVAENKVNELVGTTKIENFAASDPADAPVDWAFTPESVELNDAIVEAYPVLDNGSGFVTITSANAMTGSLNVANKDITGTMNGIENFTNITDLRLHNNQISGEIPEEIDSISSLEYMYLTNNKLNGIIPSTIGSLHSLKVLNLSTNDFSGNVPNELGQLSNLTHLYLSYNKLNGSLPSNIGGLTNLIELRASMNEFSGELPADISNLNSINTIDMFGNKFNGSIPDWLGSLPNLKVLLLYKNNFSGSIPATLGNASNLESLSLGDNSLTGELPSEIGNLTKLTSLGLDKNNFEGTIPTSIYILPALTKLDINTNPLLAGNPATGFASSSTINYLDIRGTDLIQASPEIPTLGYTVGTFLYDNLAGNLLENNKTILAVGVTQGTIDKAQESADFITDPTEKQQWQDDIDLAQKMLDAENKVDTLLTADGSNLQDGITIDDIDDAQDLVTALPDGSLKDELQAKIDTANNLLDAKNKTESLINSDGSLSVGVDQGKIDEAQAAVNKLPDGSTKTELQKIINNAQKLLDEKNFIVLHEFPVFKGNGNVSATISAPVQQFAKVYVNGTELNTGNYMITSGSTVLTLNEAYLKTLANGIYTVEVEFMSGAKVATKLVVDVTSKSSIKPTVESASVTQKSSVNTSDETNIGAVITLLMVSFVCLLILNESKKKREN